MMDESNIWQNDKFCYLRQYTQGPVRQVEQCTVLSAGAQHAALHQPTLHRDGGDLLDVGPRPHQHLGLRVQPALDLPDHH